MKKTLLALTVAALAANSASALTLIDNKETGTKLDFSGSLRLKWEGTSDEARENKHINSAVRNNGSRFGFALKQEIAEGFYAIGNVQWRMRGTSRTQHDFDDVYTRILNGGIGHKYLGELTYGHHTVITDEVKQTDLPNTYSLSDGLLNSAGRKTFQYVYKGIEGLKVGAYYGGTSKRNDSALDLTSKRKDVIGAAAIYDWKITDHNSLRVGLGGNKERWENGNEARAYAFGAAYTLYNTTLGVDLEGKDTEYGNNATKLQQREVRTVLYHRLTKDLNVYGMYAHKLSKTGSVKTIRNQYMAGGEYWLARDFLKQYNLRAKTFVEFQTSKNELTQKRSNGTVIGFRVFW